MMAFRVGEEVLFNGDRYVIAETDDAVPYRYRLLATTHARARFVWANESGLTSIIGYTEPRDDTAFY